MKPAEMDIQVSVVIPTFNSASYIDETLASVLAQDLPPQQVEVLVVDDGSTDNTAARVQTHIDAHGSTRIRWLPQANAGVSRARNHGIEQARGSHICFLDHDDWWYPHKLRRQLQALHEHPQAGVAYSTFIFWRQPAPDAPFPLPASYNIEATPDDIDPEFSGWVYHQFLLDCWMLTSTSMFKREVLERHGRFDEALPYSEDWDLWLRLAREVQFVQLRKPTTLYRLHAGQGSGWHRPVDYRGQLLARTAARYGLASRDGRCITSGQFKRQLARYDADFARGELQAGRLRSAAASYGKAWGRHPLRWKYPVYLLAMLSGWRGQALP